MTHATFKINRSKKKKCFIQNLKFFLKPLIDNNFTTQQVLWRTEPRCSHITLVTFWRNFTGKRFNVYCQCNSVAIAKLTQKSLSNHVTNFLRNLHPRAKFQIVGIPIEINGFHQ